MNVFKVLSLTILLISIALVGCQTDTKSVDQVQPYAIKKVMLDGEWYYQKKVTDVPGSHLQGFMVPAVVGWYTDLERVFFDIQEEYLYVRRATELIENAQGPSKDWKGDPTAFPILAAYKIDSHFDILTNHNPATGESYGGRVENTTDRPWWAREFIRVDWSENLAPNFELGEGLELMDQEAVPYFIQDACTPDLETAEEPDDRCIPVGKAPFFDVEWNEEGTAATRAYFDITNAFVATPRMVETDELGEIPACWLIGNDSDECVATDYHVRNSFWKIDRDERDYEPMPYSGEVSNQFGFFSDDRLVYDEQEGITEYNRRYYLNRQNIWEQSHSRMDEEGIDWSRPLNELFDPSAQRLCHTNADCCAQFDPEDPASAAGCKSTCDIHTDLHPIDRRRYETIMRCSFEVESSDLKNECEPVHYCTLPYDERRVRPVVYYVNDEWPEELLRRPSAPRLHVGAEGAGTWSYIPDQAPDEASEAAYEYANADSEDLDDRPMMEQVADNWNAALTRVINILKHRAAGSFNEDVHANTPYADSDMRRSQGGTGDFYAVGILDKDSDGNLTGGMGFDQYWYDQERPPVAICRFNPVLGPDNDPDNLEPDVCWERVQEMSRCVFNPDEPGVNPRTGRVWTEAAEWPRCTFREAAPRLGDVRYNFVWWVKDWFDGMRLTGLGPVNSDPLTGEVVSGAAHIYIHNNDVTSKIAERTMLLTGDKDPGEYVDGYDLIGWHNQYTGAGTNPVAMSRNRGGNMGSLTTMSGLMSANASLGNKIVLPSSLTPDGSARILPSELDKDGLLSSAATAYGSGHIHSDADLLSSVATHEEGAAVEADLLSEANALTMLAGSGLSPLLSVEDEEVRDALLVTRKNPFTVARYRRELMDKLSTEKLADFAMTGDFASTSMAYQVQRLRAQNKLPSDSGEEFEAAFWRMVRKKVVRSATTHEIGHTLGLRHNFAGSQDFLNYLEPYWEIRTHGCSDTTYGDAYAPDLDEIDDENPWGAHEADGCDNPAPVVGPRFLEATDTDGDPLSKYEVYKGLGGYAFASVMDYSASHAVDDPSLGRYDWAALLFGYGHHLEVYKDYPKAADGSGTISTEPRKWHFHKTIRPGFATADAPDGCTIIDDEGRLESAGIEVGARVINKVTGEESSVEEVQSDRLILDSAACFDAPMNAGEAYAVWAWPYVTFGFNGPTMVANNMTVEYLLDRYLRDTGTPAIIFSNYFIAPHYTEFYRNWVDNSSPEEDRVPNLGFNSQDNRGVRDVREFNWEVITEGNQWVPGFDLLDTTDTALRVPYAYCTDNRADISNSCRRRDYGADDWERMNHLIDEWDQWYISRSFVRGEVGERPEDYASSYYDKIYAVPKQFNDIYALNLEIVANVYNERSLAALMSDPYNSWGSFTLALHDGFNMLMRTLATPDAIDGYTPGPRPENGLYSMDYDPLLSGAAGFDIGQGARVFQTLYGNYTGPGSGSDETCGENYWRCLWNIGFYYDKIMALNALSDSATHFIGRDTAHDIRLFRISFFDNFNWQIKKHFASLMGERWDQWAPVTPVSRDEPTLGNDKYPELYGGTQVHSGTGKPVPALFWRDWANPVWDITNPYIYRNSPLLGDATKDALDDPANSLDTRWTPIDPVSGFTVQVYAMVLGMARFQNNYDPSFYNTCRMWSRTGDSLDSLGEYVSFYDPESNIIYTALKEYGVNEVFHPYSSGEETGEGIAAAMIAFANQTKSRSSDCDPGDDPITPENEEVTTWPEDDCCDNPYDGIVQAHLDPCPEEYGDPAGMTPEALAAASQNLLEDREQVDDYLKKYKGLLDFQVRLTNVYDLYMGQVEEE